MSKAFNFYEGPVPFPYHSGAGSGTYLLYPFDFSGYYTPPNITQGTTVGFLYQLNEDSDFYPEWLTAELSANVKGGNRDNAQLETSFHGLMWPLLRDTGRLDLDFSGSNVKGDSDKVYATLSFTPYLTGGNTDKPDIYLSYSGQISGGNMDNPNLMLNISSNLLSGYNTIAVLDIGFSGGFFKIAKETVGINVYMSGISVKTGGQGRFINLNDSGSFNVYMSGLIVNLSPPAH
jgi:hypothetical protein